MKKLVQILLVVYLFSICSVVFAFTAEGGARKVESLFFDSDGSVFVAFSPAPSLCQGGNRFRMHAKV